MKRFTIAFLIVFCFSSFATAHVKSGGAETVTMLGPDMVSRLKPIDSSLRRVCLTDYMFALMLSTDVTRAWEYNFVLKGLIGAAVRNHSETVNNVCGHFEELSDAFAEPRPKTLYPKPYAVPIAF